MADRTAKIERKTKETDVLVEMNLDGFGQYEIDTGIGFLDHMLTHLSKHGKIDLTVSDIKAIITAEKCRLTPRETTL